MFDVLHHKASNIDPLFGKAMLELEVKLNDLLYFDEASYLKGLLDGTGLLKGSRIGPQSTYSRVNSNKYTS